MNCIKCNSVDIEQFTPKLFVCNKCHCSITLCEICDSVMENPNSDICGHPSCIEKKMRNMFDEAQPKKDRKRNV